MRYRRATFCFIIAFVALCLSVGAVLAQPIPPTGVSVVANRDNVNVRLLPAIGAEVLGFVDRGFSAPATGRSGDGEWIRIEFLNGEGWIGVPVVDLIGDINTLPAADPRSIPYGGFNSPRAGLTDADSPIQGRLADSGMRVRAGPGRGYVILANAPRYTVMPLLGRTANNLWVQVNFEGTLGWVATVYVEFQNGASVLDLPIDGIIASELPLSQPFLDDYLDTLRLFQARLELAQVSLDEIRAIWTNAAIGVLPPCSNFPARPSNYNVPNPLLAAFFNALNPIVTDFNAAMDNLRVLIDQYTEACGRPGPVTLSQPVILGALNILQTTDAQFGDLRRRIAELLPPPRELGVNDCLFTYLGTFEILPVLPLGQVFRDQFDDDRIAAGYCFDANQGDQIRADVLRISGTMIPTIAISPLDNPSNFLLVTQSLGGTDATVLGPLAIPATGRYLLVINDLNARVREGDFSGDLAILVWNQTISPSGPVLSIDLATNTLNVNVPSNVPTPVPGATVIPNATQAITVCPSLSFTCDQLLSCAEAQACYAAGNFSLDGDGDGQPCSNLCGG